MRREIEAHIIALLEQKGKVHYTDLALALNVAIPTANNYARIFALKYSKNIEYTKGFLILKNPFEASKVNIDTRFKALQQSYKALSERVEEVKNDLIKILENDFEHYDKKELKKRLIKIIQRL